MLRSFFLPVTEHSGDPIRKTKMEPALTRNLSQALENFRHRFGHCVERRHNLGRVSSLRLHKNCLNMLGPRPFEMKNAQTRQKRSGRGVGCVGGKCKGDVAKIYLDTKAVIKPLGPRRGFAEGQKRFINLSILSAPTGAIQFRELHNRIGALVLNAQ
jgi:hypothetical protein